MECELDVRKSWTSGRDGHGRGNCCRDRDGHQRRDGQSVGCLVGCSGCLGSLRRCAAGLPPPGCLAGGFASGGQSHSHRRGRGRRFLARAHLHQGCRRCGHSGRPGRPGGFGNRGRCCGGRRRGAGCHRDGCRPRLGWYFMRWDRPPATEAGGEAAVAVGGDAMAPIITNPTMHNTFNLTVRCDEPPPAARARNLPPGVPDFTGRASEIQVIEREALVGRHGQHSVTAVVTGKPGVGKTCLAVHLAHRMGVAYEDGELYADLRGVDERPALPEEIMARFMQALGMPETEIPGDTCLRLDAYRRTVTGRSLLIVLDNAADKKQVRTLLPPGAGSLVLVTSRNRLIGLESVHRCDLEMFPTSASLDFMRKVVGEDAVDREPRDAQRVAEFCGHLPLALRIAAIRLHSTCNMRMSDLARELRDERDRLEALKADDLAVRAAFNLSYRKMGKGARNTFKSLSHVPGADFGTGICSAVSVFEVRQAAKMLRKLVDANLVEQSEVPGRFRFHDLLKVFSREKMEKGPADRVQGDRRRMLTWLQRSALKVQSTLGGVFEVELPDSGSAEIDSIETAAAWVDSEFLNAVAALGVAESYDAPERVVGLALALSGIFGRGACPQQRCRGSSSAR